MFTKLRNRFLGLLMATVTVLLILFFTAVMIFSYHNMESHNDEMLENGYDFAKIIAQTESTPDKFSPMFSVDVADDGSITEINSNFNIDEEFYKDLISNMQNVSGDTGRLSYNDMIFEYKVFELSEGQRIAFLDITNDVQELKNLISFFFWIAIPLLALIFYVSKYFADRAIKPIKESFERQNQFIADASHELKTPLAAISTNATVLLADAAPEQKKWIGYIKDETTRLEKLTSGLLYLSREPKKNAELEKCNFSDIADGIIMPLEAVFYEKNIECESKIDKDIFVQASLEQLERLVNILVENSLKYAQDKVWISLVKDSKNAVLTVSNNGVGISADELSKVWDRFYRSDKARKHQGGFGLGLSMAKTIVKELKGTVKAASVPGKLTTFTVILPLF